MHRNACASSCSTHTTTSRRDIARDVAWVLAVIGTLVVVACSKPKDGGAAAGRPDTEATTTAPTSRPADSGSKPRTEGDSSARITLSDAAFATAGIIVDTVRSTARTDSSGGLSVPAQIEFDPARIALISPRTAGRIERLAAVVGDRVSAGQPVAYLSSPEFVTAETDFLQARRRATLLAGTPDSEGTAALAVAARQRLELIGVSPSAIARLESGGEPNPLLAIPAPFSGSIVQAMALAGAAVQSGTPIFQVADVSVVNAIVQVPERALAVVHEGQHASLTVTAFPALRFAGRVARLPSDLDSVTRTIKAVVRVPNPDRRLRPGMFANVRLAVSAGAAVAASGADGSPAGLITIPESAVIVQGAQRYVFVVVAGRTFERREVEVAPFAPPGSVTAPGGRVVVRHGLNIGERIVIEGAFTLQSELAKSQFGEKEG